MAVDMTLDPAIRNAMAARQTPVAPVAPVAPRVSGATTVATQPQTAAAPAVTGATPAGALPNAYDYSADPILMQAKAFAAAANQQAQAQASARMKQLGIEYNDPSNPFSTVARLDRSHGENVTSTNESFNKANLWYGGHRIKALGDLGTALQQSKYDAANQYRGQATDVQNQLANALLGSQQNVIGAEQGAYERSLAQALKYGIDPGAAPAQPQLAAAMQPDTPALPAAASQPPYAAGVGGGGPNPTYALTPPARPAAPKLIAGRPKPKPKMPALQRRL